MQLNKKQQKSCKINNKILPKCPFREIAYGLSTNNHCVYTQYCPYTYPFSTPIQRVGSDPRNRHRLFEYPFKNTQIKLRISNRFQMMSGLRLPRSLNKFHLNNISSLVGAGYLKIQGTPLDPSINAYMKRLHLIGNIQCVILSNASNAMSKFTCI